jgi:hypothetical protein
MLPEYSSIKWCSRIYDALAINSGDKEEDMPSWRAHDEHYGSGRSQLVTWRLWTCRPYEDVVTVTVTLHATAR